MSFTTAELLHKIERLIVECESGPREYNDWPYPVTIAAARAALDALYESRVRLVAQP